MLPQRINHNQIHDQHNRQLVIVLEGERLIPVLLEAQPQLVALITLEHVLHKPAVDLNVHLLLKGWRGWKVASAARGWGEAVKVDECKELKASSAQSGAGIQAPPIAASWSLQLQLLLSLKTGGKRA